tara:strand:+ start:448 stop:870 length:423 start_codon:yes stop_codon:yes gene_type:complete
MSENYKIILNYIKDMSVEIPDAETLILARNNISKYSMGVGITSKPLKNKMIEVNTKLTYTDPEKKKKKVFFEILYATVVNILDKNIDKITLEKIILCDLQIKIYPKLETIFINILKNSGFPNIKFEKKIDFEKLYNSRLN